MKNLLLCALCFISLLSKAQTATDQNIRVTFSSYNSQWQVIVLDVESLSGCDSLFTKFRWPNHADSTIKFYKGFKGQVILPFAGGDVTVQFKTVSKCNVQSNGPWTTLSLVALAIRDNTVKPPAKKIPEGFVQIVGIYRPFSLTLRESEYQKVRDQYRRNYFILRPNRVKEIVL